MYNKRQSRKGKKERKEKKTHLALCGKIGEAALKLGRFIVAAEQVVVECCAVAGSRELVGIVAEESTLTGQEVVGRGIGRRILNVRLGCACGIELAK